MGVHIKCFKLFWNQVSTVMFLWMEIWIQQLSITWCNLHYGLQKCTQGLLARFVSYIQIKELPQGGININQASAALGLIKAHCALLKKLRFLKEINTFIQQAWIKLIKSDSKDIYNVTKDLYFCSFERSIHQRILKKSVKISLKVLSRRTVFNIDNNTIKCFLSTKSAFWNDWRWRLV